MAETARGRLNWTGLGVFALVLLVWEAAVRSGLIAFEFFPPPSRILLGIVALTRDGVMLQDLLHTLGSIAAGWSIAMLIGVAIGVLLGFSPTARRFGLASVEVLRPMPGIAFAPVGLLLFGFSLQTELVVTVLPTIWPVMVNTMGGIANVHPRLGDVGRTLRLSNTEIVRHLLLPAALPSIIVGARISLGLALVMAIVAEIVGNPAGLGYGIVREQQAMNPEYMFAYIAVVGILGIALNAGVVALTTALWPATSRVTL
ncbi:ABC transporter permease [Rhodopseudomonas sp. B29]|uniref:ABC transporter permease n=1 Tax=Rhodopseudomonas sp. B29 TaxID=95607 RepID=UPI00034A2D33|nr:ABC transporter permease [Rhodopseudomonas sp. B29]